MEALTAVVFAFGVAAAFLFLPVGQAETALVGDISKVRLDEAAISVTLCLVLFLIVRRIYSKIVLINISEELARSDQINVKKVNLIYLASIAVIVALGVKMVGGLLTAALVAIPASTARNLSRNLTQYALGAMIIGALSSFLGILLFRMTGFPAGPLIILVGTFVFLISMVFKR
jgi:ABC-type Mn2+/Zn2+ transport system permease subunit